MLDFLGKQKISLWLPACIALGLLLFYPGLATADDTIVSSELELSSHEPSTAVNATFTLDSGLVAGEGYIFSMPGFDLSSLVATDFDLIDDGVHLSIADDCSGSEEAAVFVGVSTIFLDICTGDGGTIGDGSEVVVRIGNHATFEGTGANQIETPSTETTHWIQVATTTTFSSAIAVPIVATTNGAVSATVVPPNEGGGGGGAQNTNDQSSEAIDVSYPVSGLRFVYGDVIDIEWESQNLVGTVNLHYSTDGGDTWSAIVTGETDDGLYSWPVPNISSSQMRVRADAIEGGSVQATDSTGNFFLTSVVVPVYDITVSGSIGSELTLPTTQQVSWSATGSFSSFDVFLDRVGESSLLLASNLTTSSYTATLPISLTPGSYQFRILGYKDGLLKAQAYSSVFTLASEIEPEPEPDPEPEPEPEPGPEPGPQPEPGPGPTPEPGGGVGPSPGNGGTTGGTMGGETGSGGSTPATPLAIQSSFSSIGGHRPVGDGAVYSVIAGTPIDITAKFTGGVVREARVIIGSEVTIMNESIDGVFSTRIIAPDRASPITIVASKTDGTEQLFVYTLSPAGTGAVVSDSTGEPVSGAIVTVFTYDGGARTQWASPGQQNPVITANGIAWYVENGTYIVTAGRDGFEEVQEIVVVKNGVLNPTLRLKQGDLVTDPSEQETTLDNSIVPVAVSDVAKRAVQQVSRAAEAIDEIRALPEVQVVGRVSEPAVAVSAATSVAVLGSSFNLIPYLQYVVTAPLAWFARRKKRPFGLIFDADSLLPVPLASVRLVGADGKVMGTGITNMKGEFFLRVLAGTYRLAVSKSGYELATKSQVGSNPYSDVYTGEELRVTDKEVFIAPSIAVVKTEAAAIANTPRRIRLRRLSRAIAQAFGFSGVVFAFAALVILQTPTSLLMMLVQVLAYALVRLLAKRSSHKGWGIVQDAVSKSPLPNSIVRLFDPTYNKLLETTLTDGRGRYAILAGPKQYYATVEQPGYEQKTINPIDFSKNSGPALVSVNVSLHRAQS